MQPLILKPLHMLLYPMLIGILCWKNYYRDFPGNPVVKTSPSNAEGCRFNPLLGS